MTELQWESFVNEIIYKNIKSECATFARTDLPFPCNYHYTLSGAANNLKIVEVKLIFADGIKLRKRLFPDTLDR